MKNLTFRCIAYLEKNNSFTAVCLDLDLVEEGHTSLEEAILSINDAIIAHIETAKRLGFPKELIFRPAPKKYWKKLIELTKEKPIKTSSSRSPFDFRTVPISLSANNHPMRYAQV